MGLIINIRHLEEKEIFLRGELSLKELDLGLRDELIRLKKPLKYDLEVGKLDQAVLVRGSLMLELDCDCARCLQPFEHKVVLSNWAVHLPLSGEEKVSLDNDFLDLTPYVREDILLEFPQHPLCKSNCAGFRKKSANKETGGDKDGPSAWAGLDKLKF